MNENKNNIKSDLAKVDAYILTQEDYEEIPEITDEMFDRGVWTYKGEIIRRGRPKTDSPKIAKTIRYDADVVNAFQHMGKGWQTKMNDALREWLSSKSLL